MFGKKRKTPKKLSAYAAPIDEGPPTFQGQGTLEFPDECGSSKVEGWLLNSFYSWIRRDCPHIDSVSDTQDRPSHSAALSVSYALQADNEITLTDIARRPYPYARLTVASRSDTPTTAMWGDGVVWFGLAHDIDPWVRGTALLNCPEPPAELVMAVCGMTAKTPAEMPTPL